MTTLQIEKKAKRDSEGYFCSNPTCKSVFSHPKIIKYYACPNCNTRVEMVDIENQSKIEQINFKEKSVKLETIKPRYIQTKEVETTRHISKTQSTKINPKNSFIPEITVPEQNLTIEIKESDSQSDTGCKHYFGYLCEREKGEGIPNECVECSKILDCMLSKVHQSTKSVKEIKKWYHFR